MVGGRPYNSQNRPEAACFAGNDTTVANPSLTENADNTALFLVSHEFLSVAGRADVDEAHQPA